MRSREQKHKWSKDAFGSTGDPQSLPLPGLWTEPNGSFWPGALVEGDDPAALPGVGSTLAGGLDRLASIARQLGQTWRQLASAMPLDPGLNLDLEMTKAEKLLERDLSRLKQVCNRPRSHLRAEERREPVSLVRRITPRTIERLAAKSEDWQARTFRGVRPARLLAQVTDDDWAIYENRATVTLQRHLMRVLNQRAASLLALLRQIEAIDQIDGNLSRGSRFRLDRASWLLGEAFRNPPSAAQLRELYETVSKLDREVRGLTGSELLKQSRLMAPVRPPLRLTNVFRDDDAYRQVAGLWWEWIERKAEQPVTMEEVIAIRQGRILAHSWLTLVLVLRALTEMRLVNNKAPSWNSGQHQPLELKRGWQLILQPEGMIWLARNGCLVGRILPLSVNWCRLPAELAAPWWGQLDKMTAGIPTLCVGMEEEQDRQARPDAGAIWPSQLCAAERSNVSSGRLSYSSISPQRLDSIEGVLRFLRMVVYREDWPVLPVRIQLQSMLAGNEARGRGLEVNEATVVLNRRPAPSVLASIMAEAEHAEAESQRAQVALGKLRDDVKRLRKMGEQTGHLKAQEPRLEVAATAARRRSDVLGELSTKLALADAAIEVALRCPCCKSKDEAEIVAVRFRCVSCGTEWGREASTGAAFIHPKGSSDGYDSLWGADFVGSS